MKLSVVSLIFVGNYALKAMPKFTLIVIFVHLITFKSFCQIKSTVDKNSNWEVYYDRVPVSGEIRVGAVTSESDDKIIPSRFFVRIPEHNENNLCVDISSRDGRYEASLPYDIKGLKPNVYEFELPTKHVSELRNYTQKDITILTKIGTSCQSESSYFVLSSWQKADVQSERLLVYLNSEKPTFLRYKDKITNEIQDIECQKIASPASIAFNCKCELATTTFSGLTELYIRQRVRRGTTFFYNTYPFPIKF